MNVRRLGYALGAEITGVDLTKPLDAPTVKAIRDAWLEHIVICIPGQDLTARQLRDFAGEFGELDDNRGVPRLSIPTLPTVGLIASQPVEYAGRSFTRTVADLWHSDQSYTAHPSVATFLNAKRLPSIGGDTQFVNMHLAYEALSSEFKRLAGQLEGVHDYRLSGGYSGSAAEQKVFEQFPPIARAIVLEHPETGRKVLHVGARVTHFVGMTVEESKPLIDFLNAHCTRYEFMYRHRWSLHDVVMWDNRSAMHYAVSDYDPSELRQLLRCTTLGPRSGYVVGQAAGAEQEHLAAT